jgi:hypothetical protein
MPHAPLIGRRSLVPVTLLAACALTIPASAHAATIPVVGDAAAASSGRALTLATTRSVTTTVALRASAKALAIRARGVSCAGAPTLRIAVDDARPVAKTLRGGKYQTLTAGKTLTAGSHRVTVALTKAYKSRACRRAVIIDSIRIAGQTPPRVPEEALVAGQPTAAAVAPATAAVTAPAAAPEVEAPAPEADVAPEPEVAPEPPSTTTPTTTTTSPSTPAPPATTTTPTEPAPTAPVDTRPKLRWAPPTLTSPTTVNVPQGDQTLSLSTTKDYIINLGSTPHVGQVIISGGRNVVMIGGTIGLPLLSTKATALGIKGSTGIVHVEGLQFDGTSGKEMDAIQIQAPQATVQVQNVRADGILGTFDTNHSDVIQPWGGVAKLRVDRLTADSNYQGIFTRPDQGAIGSVSLQNVDMSFNNSAATSSGGYLLWMTTGCDMAPTTLSNVYITPRSGKTLAAAVWPTPSDAGCPAKLASNKATWPTLPVTGAVNSGPPPGGAYVPAGSVGVHYTTPGYQ